MPRGLESEPVLSLPGVVSVPLKPPPIPGQLGEGREELGHCWGWGLRLPQVWSREGTLSTCLAVAQLLCDPKALLTVSEPLDILGGANRLGGPQECVETWFCPSVPSHAVPEALVSLPESPCSHLRSRSAPYSRITGRQARVP